MTAQPTHDVSEDEYLAFDRTSTTKHEYYHGRIYAMTGAKEPHNLIAANTIAALHGQLRKRPCRVYPSDMRVKVVQTGLNTYPDITVVCGQPQFTDTVRDTLINPTVIIEILSPSTERYDRGVKFQHYRTIATLSDYILIAQDHSHVEYFSRQEDGLWLFREAVQGSSSISIRSIDCTLSIEDVYEKVEFDRAFTDLPRDIPSA